jgi:hypothetical protein
MRPFFLLAGVVLGLSLTSLAQDHEHEQMSTLKPSPEFQQMKTLAGKWEGTFGGKPAKAEFRLTGDGSALMQILAEGTPYEMVTMFHMDGERLLATHYCAAHNQPRMQAAAGGDGKSIQFNYVDGTNIAPGDSHMDNVKVTMLDADHHQELWTSTEKGKSSSMLFDFHRIH